MSMAIFRTKISVRRLTLSPFSSEQMAKIAQTVVDHKIARIKRGIDSNDTPSKALVAHYAARKSRRGLVPKRDWTWSGMMLRSLKVKRADQNRATYGFVNERADMKATIQRRMHEMLADSPTDTEVLNAAVRTAVAQHQFIRQELLAQTG